MMRPCACVNDVLVRTRAQSNRSRCALLLWRHLEKSGGTSLRVAFERLELATAKWTAIGRPERLEQTQWNCRRRDVNTFRPRALRAFENCAGGLVKQQQQRHAWSVEYHVANDGALRFARDLHALRGLMTPAVSPRARVVVVLVVREPHAWYASEWRLPEGQVWHASAYTRHNFSNFVRRVGPNFQWRSLLRDSGLNRTDSIVELLIPQTVDIRRVLSTFDVVGVTEQLASTMFLICEAVGLARCPALPPPRKTGRELGYTRRAYVPSRNHSERALVEIFASADVQLHRLATQRLDAALHALDANAQGAWRRYVGAPSQRRPAPCAHFKWGRRKRSVGSDLYLCKREARNGSRDCAGALPPRLVAPTSLPRDIAIA